MPGRIQRLRPLVLLAALLLLAACSRLDLAYRNLDLVIPWWIGNYVSLEPSQKAWLEPRLQRHLTWHCRTQLPEYVAWLDDMSRLSQRPSLTEEEVQERITRIRGAMTAIAREITPTALGLTESLTPRQMGQIYVAMDERNAELREEHVAPSLAKQAESRAQRMEDRVQEWLGPLRADQRRSIHAWARAQGDYNRIWAENREAWLVALRTALYGRHLDDFPSRLTALLQQPERFWTTDYRDTYPRVERNLARLLSDLFNSADTSQRAHLRQRIDDLVADLEGLECYPR